VTGFVQDVHCHRPLSRLADAASGTIGYEAHLRAFGVAELTQITIVDSDLLSYTMQVPVPEIELELGALVEVELKRVRVLSSWHFLCTSLQLIRFGKRRPAD
jgi:Fe2+ transport system protein FeoA